jgi:hypothetical protein
MSQMSVEEFLKDCVDKWLMDWLLWKMDFSFRLWVSILPEACLLPTVDLCK